ERAGDDDVAGRRQHAATEEWMQALRRVAVGRHDDTSRAHGAAGREQHVVRALAAPAHDRRALVDEGTPATRRRGQAPHVLQWVQPEGVARAQRAERLGATEEALALEPRAVEIFHAGVAERLTVEARALLQRGGDGGAMRDHEGAGGLRVALDLLAADEI